MLRDPMDQGILLYLTPVAGAATYRDRHGTTQDSEAFAGAAWVAAASLEIGRGQYLAVDMLINRTGGGLTNVLVRCTLTRRTDTDNNPLITWSPAPLATTTTKAGGATTTAFEHTLVPGDGAALRLLSDDVLLGGTLVIELANTGAPAGADKVIVAAACGGS